MMKIKYWAIIILATLAVCAGVFYYLKQPAPDLGTVTVHHQAKLVAPSTTAASSTEVNGWKTYTNSQYKFSFKYPQNLSLDQDSATTLPAISIREQNANPYLEGDYDYSVIYEVNKNNLSMRDYFNGQNGSDLYQASVISTTTVDSLPAVSFIGSSFDMAPQETVVVPYMDGFIEISNNTSGDDIFDALLSTFEFSIPSPASTTQASANDWQTYTNSQYGFSFQYPTLGTDVQVSSSTDSSGLELDFNYLN